eukprot:CAMPEP_0185585438 /NCGR_PEP_ID=MMETSP0434-20130131/38703_1 /TAXON_ID=626734 ORGANISM="Favella taraikaensis, Strain Fe Narragansett Bay" /NCGR_SAMPLE_ID=MMETSP0434 /ASSEMBLY_ACC=CAM_ASM_000379 /LENGTH=54 /DNA_ID=CAMNT_0028205765 /DNA_START=894 /DNA_END=1055 /DNA_ORIENTATION=+
MINIVGTLKDVLLTYTGFVFLGEPKCTPVVLAGLGISFAGAAYSLKFKMKLVQQ